MLIEQLLIQGCYCCLFLNHQTKSGPCRELLFQAVTSWLSWSAEGAVGVQLLVWLCPLGASAPAWMQSSSCCLLKSSWHELGAFHGGQKCPQDPASPGHSCHQDPLGSCTWLSWLHFRWKRALLGQVWQPWKGPGRWAAFSHALLSWMSCACWNYLLHWSINTLGTGLYFMNTTLSVCLLLYFKSINNSGAAAGIKAKLTERFTPRIFLHRKEGGKKTTPGLCPSLKPCSCLSWGAGASGFAPASS